MRKCNTCDVEKKETEFRKGYAKCKSCLYEVIKAWRKTPAGMESRRKARRREKESGKNYVWQKRYDATPLGKARSLRYENKRFKGAHGKARLAARNAVRYAVRVGKLKRQPCQVCGSSIVHGHHDSHAWEDRLKVRWLCERHHNEIHNPPMK